MNTYMHKVSKMVIEYAKENRCGKIVIGNIKGIKYKMKYNSNFVQVPIQSLVKKIIYKAKLEGIEVETIGEKYICSISPTQTKDIKYDNTTVNNNIVIKNGNDNHKIVLKRRKKYI